MYCQICLDKYNIHNRIPRNLSCGHTYCDKCLKKLANSYEIECPKCRQRSVNNLPICYAIYDKILLDDKSDPDISCDVHEFEKLIFYCNDDKEIICPLCLSQNHRHHNVGLLRDKYIADEYIDIMNKWKEYLVMKRDKFDKIKIVLKDSINECENDKVLLCREVEIYYNKLLKSYEDIKKDIIKKIEMLHSIEISKITKIMNNIDQILDKMNSFLENEINSNSFYSIKTIKENEINLEKLAISENNKIKFYDIIWSNYVFLTLKKKSLELNSYNHNLKNNIVMVPDIKDSSIINYDIPNNTFSTKQLLIGNDHEFLDYSSSVQFNEDTIIITGGCNYSNYKNTASNKTYLMKFINDKYISIKEYIPMNINRFSHGSLMINGIVYVFGGHNGRYTLSSMECLNPNSDYWSALPNMNIEKEIFAYCAVKSRYIYTFGGFQDLHLDIIERYDILHEKWKKIKTKLKLPLQNSTAVNVRDEYIVLIGGYNYHFQRTIFTFYINTQEWSEVDYYMKFPRRKAHCYLHENKVIQ
jgi:hypothetical protein